MAIAHNRDKEEVRKYKTFLFLPQTSRSKAGGGAAFGDVIH